jgi:6-pyruvoyltetrahydropterin/6-carboxytetrahydropterin synthase
MIESLLLHTEVIIDSAHRLENYQGKCANLHGHSWRIELWFRGDKVHKDKVGILVDFGIVKALKEKLDHQVLNDIMPEGVNPTDENLVEFIYECLRREINNSFIDVKVKVWETSLGKETWCEGGDF